MLLLASTEGNRGLVLAALLLLERGGNPEDGLLSLILVMLLPNRLKAAGVDAAPALLPLLMVIVSLLVAVAKLSEIDRVSPKEETCRSLS